MIEIKPIGSYDVKSVGRVYLVRTSDLPTDETLKLGCVVILKDSKMRVRGIMHNSEAYVGLMLEDA